MIRIFSSTYSVAALATMAMTMTYSNGVVSAATMEEAAAAAVNNTEAAANQAVANILNLGAACKPKPFVQVCTASDCICGEYHCDAEHMCVNCPISSDGTVRVSPCDSGNVTTVGDDDDDDEDKNAATVAAIKDMTLDAAKQAIANAQGTNVDWATDSSNNTSFVTDAANEQVQATVDAAKEAIATAQATVDAAPAATATDSADHADDTDHADSADHVTDAAATATDTVNNSVKVEVSSASLLSASMMGIAAVTTAFVAIA